MTPAAHYWWMCIYKGDR